MPRPPPGRPKAGDGPSGAAQTRSAERGANNPSATYAVASSTQLQVREAPGLPWPLQSAPASGDLPDINVWLALAVQEHPHHEHARRYWTEAQGAQAGTAGAAQPCLWFCRTTMLGLVRLLCQPKAVGKGALEPTAAWGLYQRYRALPQIGLLGDPPDCEAQLDTLVNGSTPLPMRLWTDAYLAALAKSSGLRLVSFDRDFQRFSLARCLILPTM